MAQFSQRMIRAAKLDPALYEEVEADRNALGQAMGVVVLSSVAAGLGTSFHGSVGGIVGGAVAALIGWFVWAFLTYAIGTKIFPEPQTQADLRQLLRATGFASAPGIIRILAVIPGVGGFIFFIAMIWMLIAMVISIRQALDYTSTLRAVGVCVIGWLVQVVMIFVLFSMMGVPIATIESESGTDDNLTAFCPRFVSILLRTRNLPIFPKL